MAEELLTSLIDIAGSTNVRVKEPMKQHTTFKIGGCADYFVTPDTVEALQALVRFLNAKDIPFYIVGNGSNLLVSDAGFRGVIIQLYDNFSRYSFLHDDCGSAADKANKVYIRAQAGVSLVKLGSEAANYSLTGFEFASGIPGTVGGAVVMNAGAYGGEMKDVLVKATVMNQTSGDIYEMTTEELQLGYRTSAAAKQNLIVLDAVLGLSAGNQQEIKARILELAKSRREKQPLTYPSAGSTFKRPQGYFAGKLIADAGLKGLTVGGAQVSEKHAGFVVNIGNATAQDVIELTEKVTERVWAAYGVKLELEVKKLGF